MLTRAIRHSVCLIPDSTLLCQPGAWSSLEAKAFSERYRDNKATFVSDAEVFIGPLDPKGRIPGRYADPDHIMVRFFGEERVQKVNHQLFVLLDYAQVSTILDDSECQRIGNLLHLPQYYPGDKVAWPKHDNFPRAIDYVRFGADGVPHYQIEGLTMSVDELVLKSRGNVWALYHDPPCLSFASDEEELKFWLHSGISAMTVNPDLVGEPKAVSFDEFRSGSADIVYYNKENSPWHGWTAQRLHECWATHRPRVRALTRRLYQAELAGEDD